jgi:hypothetical protein
VPDPNPDPYLDFVSPPSDARNKSYHTRAPALSLAHPSERAHIVYAKLCLINRLWYAETRPYLWSIVKIGMPASFEKVLLRIGTSDDGVEDIARATRRELCLSPPASRDASPVDRGRRTETPQSLSSIVWARSASVESARDFHRARSLTRREDSPGSIDSFSILHPEPFDENNPGLLISYLSFSRFRTHGMRRSVREGSQHRFVTAARMLRLLRGTRAPGSLVEGGGVEFQEEWDVRGRLAAVGLTEYMDSALSKEVLEELLLRGPVDVRYRAVGSPDKTVVQKEGTPAALAARPIVALDLCGCVSARFVEGLTEFVAAHRLRRAEGNVLGEETRQLEGYDGEWVKDRAFFPHLRRLGLSQTLLEPDLLTAFVSSFPHLTHLDLSLSRALPALLESLANTPGMKLESLSLGRCQSLTSESIRRLLVESSVTATLRDLSLYGDLAMPTRLTATHLLDIVTHSACFQSGQLRVLDLSSVPISDEMLENFFPTFPQLVELGLANCRQITFNGVSNFLASKAARVEVLDLSSSCASFVAPAARGRTVESLVNIVELHSNLINRVATTDPSKFASRKTRLRVLELDERTLEALQAGVGDWKVCSPPFSLSFRKPRLKATGDQVIWGRGRRGWYVDTGVTSAPDRPDELRQLDKDDPRRLALLRLVQLNGVVSSDIGWHSRKMEGEGPFVNLRL